MISMRISIREDTLLTGYEWIALKQNTKPEGRQRLWKIRLTCIRRQSEPRVSDKESKSTQTHGTTRSWVPETMGNMKRKTHGFVELLRWHTLLWMKKTEELKRNGTEIGDWSPTAITLLNVIPCMLTRQNQTHQYQMRRYQTHQIHSTLPSPGYSMWNPWKGGLHKFQVDSMEWWMESMEWGMESMEWGMESILLVDGFHGMGDGFHGFSTWIPSFSTWIPWNFQMDSIWNEFMES